MDTAEQERTAGARDEEIRLDTLGSSTLTIEPVPADTPVIITIDGPAGTGKSTVARMLASRLGLDFLDTGAMYRAATAIVIDHGLRGDLEAGVYGRILEKVIDADLHFDWQADPPAILAWLKPLNERIRQRDVTGLVSKLSTIGTLRKHMVQKQRIIGHQHPRLVTEGRDQGSVAFPDAEVKFYLDAEPRVRAHRRALQLGESGVVVDEQTMLGEILERDRIDSTRSDGPLVCPADAIVIDTSDLTIEEVVEAMAVHAEQRVGWSSRDDS
ncbi:MAG: (d)CMP kinase [Phycisphaeraceae bacterium]|nr:MAG: (d)CMP kinase [Phycisphaeraceae bacterium]